MGNKASRVLNSAGGLSLRSSLNRGRGFEQFGNALQLRNDAQTNNITQEQNLLQKGANSAVQQKFMAVGGRQRFAGNLEQTLRRGKARQGVLNRGDKAIRNQQLKDRLTAANRTVNRRGQLQNTAGNAIRLRAGLDSAKAAAKNTVSSAIAGAAGSILGGAIRGFGGSIFDGTESVDPITDQGTASADFFNSNPGFGFNGLDAINGNVGSLNG